MIPYWMSRTQLMLGDEKVENLRKKSVLVIGLGGVGGICAEMIARAGVGKMTIVDNDTVDASNINRQIHALTTTLGKSKVIAMKERMLEINPACEIHTVDDFISNENIHLPSIFTLANAVIIAGTRSMIRS